MSDEATGLRSATLSPAPFSEAGGAGLVSRTSLRRWVRRLGAAGLVLLCGAPGCTEDGTGIEQKGRLRVTVELIDGTPPPPVEAPLPANIGDTEEAWSFKVEAIDGAGNVDPSFNGFVRIDVEPGSVDRVEGVEAAGRNIRLVNGYAEGTAHATAMFGPARLWAEDLGYEPAPDGVTPTCSNGIDDDDDVMVDHPNDAGCAFADDMSEEASELLSGVSEAMHYALPSIADVQGRGAKTPYGAVAMQIDTYGARYVVVTRVSSNGFFVTDLADQAVGHNHLFAYNFNTPEGMRVCDQLTYLSGTASEFFGFTEISFPSFEVNYLNAAGQVFGPDDCQVPEPVLLDPPAISVSDPVEMEKLESGLVRIEDFTISDYFGPELAINNAFGPNKSNCDLNQDGVIDYLDPLEGSCSDACTDEPRCSEWTNYVSWGAYKVYRGIHQIRVSTATAFGFDPLASKGQAIGSVTGTLRNFSGGGLNWTIETRCVDDLLCDYEGCPAHEQTVWEEAEPESPARYCELCTECPVACEPGCADDGRCGWRCPVRTTISSRCACVSLRTEVDNDSYR